MAESLGGEVSALLRRTLVGAAAAGGMMCLATLLAPGHGTAHAARREGGQSDPVLAASDPAAFRFVALGPNTATPASPDVVAPVPAEPVRSGVLSADRSERGVVVEPLASPAISTSVGSLVSGSTPDPAQLAVLLAALLAVLWTRQRLRTSAHIWRACSSPPGRPARERPRVPTSPQPPAGVHRTTQPGGNQQL